MNDRNATGSTFCNDEKKKKAPVSAPPPTHLTVLFTQLFSPISINYYKIALITLVQLLMLKLKMKHVLPGTDAVLENL